MRWRDKGGKQPAGFERVDEAELLPPRETGVGDRLGTGVELAAGAGFGAAQALAGAALDAGRTLRDLVSDGSGQYGRLQRLGRIGARTRISFGLLLSESAAESP